MANIKIYTRMMCGYCMAAKRLLESKGAQFKELDATFNNELRNEMMKLSNGKTTFPQIFIGDTHVGGCDELHALNHSGKLDVMLST